MRTFLALALSTALTSSIFLTRSLIVELNRHACGRIVGRVQADDSTNTRTFMQRGQTFTGKKTK